MVVCTYCCGEASFSLLVTEAMFTRLLEEPLNL
jgi:hypothetical protein